MIRLSATTHTLEIDLLAAHTTSALDVLCSYSDATTTGYAGLTETSASNGTTAATIVSAPAASTVRDIDYINIFNKDTVSHTVSISHSISGTLKILFKATILTGEQIQYTHASGWSVLDTNGNRKEVTSSVFSSLTVTGAPSPFVIVKPAAGAVSVRTAKAPAPVLAIALARSIRDIPAPITDAALSTIPERVFIFSPIYTLYNLGELYSRCMKYTLPLQLYLPPHYHQKYHESLNFVNLLDDTQQEFYQPNNLLMT